MAETSRRNFIRFATGIGLDLVAAPAMSALGQPPADHGSPNFYGRLEKTFLDNRYTIFADPNHRNAQKTLNLFSDESFLNCAQKAGVTTLFMEYPKECQVVFDIYENDCQSNRTQSQFDKSKKEFANMLQALAGLTFFSPEKTHLVYEHLADIVRLSGQRGIRVVAVDEIASEQIVAQQKVLGSLGNETNREFIATHTAEQRDEMERRVADEVFTLRDGEEDGANIARNVKETLDERGGRAIGLYGVMHVLNIQKAIQDFPSSAAIIGVHLSQRDFHENAKNLCHRSKSPRHQKVHEHTAGQSYIR